jgi:hypothetical protein
MYTCGPSYLEVDVGELMFKASLGKVCVTPYLKKQTKM